MHWAMQSEGGGQGEKVCQGRKSYIESGTKVFLAKSRAQAPEQRLNPFSICCGDKFEVSASSGSFASRGIPD